MQMHGPVVLVLFIHILSFLCPFRHSSFFCILLLTFFGSSLKALSDGTLGLYAVGLLYFVAFDLLSVLDSVFGWFLPVV